MSLQEENERLKRRIEELERKNHLLEQTRAEDRNWPFPIDHLPNAEIKRFGRQLILPDVGMRGQLKLRNTSMLVVGAGGLGSPICLYLGGAGVGRIGVVDHDDVDVSNLHRQVIHDESKVGVNKAESAAASIKKFVLLWKYRLCRFNTLTLSLLLPCRINSSCQVIPYNCVLDSSNAMDIISK